MQSGPAAVPAPALLDSLAGLPDDVLLTVASAALRRLQNTTLGAEVDDQALRDRVRVLQSVETMAHAEKLRSLTEVDARQAYRAKRNAARRTGWRRCRG